VTIFYNGKKINRVAFRVAASSNHAKSADEKIRAADLRRYV